MSIGLTQDVQNVVLTLMEGLACPRAVAVAILLRSGDWAQLIALKAVPSHYSNSEDYFRAAAATDLLRKYADVAVPGVDPEAAAISKWWWAERECYATNERLNPLLEGGSHGSIYGTAVGEFLSSIRKEFSYLLGNSPTDDLDGRFGPGATMSDKSRAVTVPDKMSSAPSLTPDQWPLLSSWRTTAWGRAYLAREGEVGWSGVASMSFVRGNSFFTVPKDASTHRGCAKEPSIPFFYQRALGILMRNRMRRRGINLEVGQDLHRQVACAASISDDSVTIDLTSASDCLAFNLVKLIATPAWFEQLNLCRSPYTLIEGRWVRLEKFSSMGNGYTFELETAVFASIAMAACGPGHVYGRDVYVYGDDIIVPKDKALDVLASLKFFGLTPNMKKTFLEGPFRESCGGDFFDGVGVRPFQLEEDPNEPQKLISFANGIRRMACQNGSSPLRWRDLRRAWFRCLDLLPAPIRRCRGPQALGDAVIHDDEDQWDKRSRNSIRYIRSYRPATYRKVAWEGYAYDVQYAAALYGVTLLPQQRVGSPPMRGDRDRRWLVPRDGVTGYKVGWIPYS